MTTEIKRDRVSIVGVGRMGANMARRLAERNFHVTAVYDVNHKAAVDLAAELGCAAANTLAEVAAAADFILTVVTDDAAMRQIFLGDGDTLLASAADAAGKIFVNFATVSPQVHLEVGAAAAHVGAVSIEACMASSITQARQGTLYLILAGDEGAVAKAEPVLEALSAARRHVGAAGKAAQVKALVNMVMNINTAGLAEGLAVGDALGIDLAVLREIFSQTGANSRVLETDGADMANREHECYFSAAHAAKDSGIAGALAKEAGIAVPVSDAALGQYRKMVEKGLGELDKSGVAELTFKGRAK
ncbi:3-hydroxyisobutyrate dehydrogenase [Verrucomicrobium sp. GAS474]|uniref:NAD(P)-dependent oxidoreductase n=1 Tax=Verrucomicrobium sp. GAS474 TaxID=1882831 RepID=UPI00087D3789|nr:NAD(P)-dependent oxidoreductase [Verrucomicrobium sp. GAS474]SDT98360.1 3-hydroxyisobutyrate dehydrogenase [Verrucomicrobium sp. GAS474]